MMRKRIIACLDVRGSKVVKGTKFQNHRVMGDIVELAKRYSDQELDELVFYDISASPQGKSVDVQWVEKVARVINIPFSVAGGINNLTKARNILNSGADKISLNSPAIRNPELIPLLSKDFGKQAITIGIDYKNEKGQSQVFKNTGDESTISQTILNPLDWALKVEELGAGEIVFNCINTDGMKNGYDIKNLKIWSKKLSIPLVASGGAGNYGHFVEVFKQTKVTGALAASVFHKNEIEVSKLRAMI